MWVYGIDMKYASVKIYVWRCFSVAGKLFLPRFDFLYFIGEIGFSGRFVSFSTHSHYSEVEFCASTSFSDDFDGIYRIPIL